ncbi:MAG TPA: hypothetical protein VJ715_01275 [Pyrinomonadaceae bacterium]|nr:hypothetical protein [Pyrinomonadaceae bacterium]
MFCLAVAVMNLHPAAVLGASSGTPVPAAGVLSVSGSVLVDGTPGLSGQTCFSGSTFAVAERSRSTLTLHNRGRVELSAETTLKLDFNDESATGTLDGGRLRVFVPTGVAARFTAADAAVRSDSGQPALFTIETERGGATTVSVELGQVEMSDGKRTEAISAGQLLSTNGGSQPLPSPRQSLSGKQIATLGIGFGLLGAVAAIIFTRKPAERLDFGGCVIVPSGLTDPVPEC